MPDCGHKLKQPKQAFCVRCSSIFKSDTESTLVCPKCNWSVDAEDYRKLYSEGWRVIRFGHDYREMYTREFEESGRIGTKACLCEPPDWYVFAGIAALSGIIGNAAYDTVKYVIKRLYEGRPKGEDYSSQRLSEDETIDILVRNVREYMGGMPNAELAVRKAIEEEEMVDIAVEEKARLRSDKRFASAGGLEGDRLEVEIYKAALKGAIERIKSGDTSFMDRSRLQQLLSDAWHDLPR